MASRTRESEDDDEDFPGICWEAKRQKLEKTSSQRCITDLPESWRRELKIRKSVGDVYKCPEVSQR